VKSDVDRLVDEAIRAPFSGWDFSWLDGRVRERNPPWDYEAEAAHLLSGARRTLDIDTGGGEVLARLASAPGMVTATEGYRPNIEVASRTLTPLGVHVVGADSAPDNVDQTTVAPSSTGSHLPFTDLAFDVVLDRHSSYWPGEVARVLRPGGTFLTQQRGVGGHELSETFGHPSSPTLDFDLAFVLRQLETTGLDIIRAEEAETPSTFLDVGALVYFLRAVPWVVPGFDVERDREALRVIHAIIGRDGGFDVAGSHMLIAARRP
jgi:SAM-dependent methyltransferase